MSGRRLAVMGVAVLVAGFLVAGLLSRSSGGGRFQNVTFVFPAATNLFSGSRAEIDGFPVGKVTSLEVKDAKALVHVRVDKAHAPLREGTKARISYLSFPGERYIEVLPGPKSNGPLPEGAMITANTPRVELDQILATLDPPTRAALRRIVPELDTALAGHEADVGKTLETAGPAVEALTDVLAAVGEDGPALRRLLTSVRELAERLVAHKEALRQTIDGFDRNLTAMAGRDEELRAALDDLPAVLDQATSVLGRLPGAAAATLPLLGDFRQAAEALPQAAADLRPFLADLRPTLVDLRPVVASLSSLLDETPSLLDRAHAVVPPTNRVLSGLLPVLSFLRPYTPELAGALANVNSAAANYDANGHFVRIWASTGSLGYAGQSQPLSPTIRQNPDRRPGELEGQPLVDAAGSAMR